MSDEILIAELRRDEGVRDKPYDDKTGKAPKLVGKLTIGVGRNLSDRGLSDDEIDYLLANDIALVDAELDRHIAWWRELDPVRTRVLQNMCFNLGWPRLSKFRKALLAVKEERWADAAAEMLNSTWAKQTGQRAVRLAKMMKTGAV